MRIDDRRMGAGGERVDDAHVLLGQGVGAIHDAERRLAARDECQRGAHVVGARRPCCSIALQTPSAVSAALARTCPRAPRRDWRARCACRRARAARSRPGASFSRAVRGRGRDRARARCRAGCAREPGRHELALLDVVDPVGVGGDEEVRGRAVLDLPRERVAAGVRDDDLVAVRGLERLRRARRALPSGSRRRTRSPCRPSGGERRGRRAARARRAAHARNIPPDITNRNTETRS